MNEPATTGVTAKLLETSEPKLNDLIRRRRIDPPPPVVSGRRFWGAEHIRQAAQALGITDIERRLATELA